MSEHIYRPSHIANYFLKRAHKEGIDVTQLKLLKLVYIGYGWAIALLDRKLFEERIEAWPHGPVIPALYNEFKHYGKSPIDVLATEFSLDSEELKIPKINTSDKEVLIVLSKVWEIYHRFNVWSLVDKTHEPNTPWTETYKDGDGRNDEIPPDLIQAHFKRKIAEYLDRA